MGEEASTRFASGSEGVECCRDFCYESCDHRCMFELSSTGVGCLTLAGRGDSVAVEQGHAKTDQSESKTGQDLLEKNSYLPHHHGLSLRNDGYRPLHILPGTP